MITDRDPEFIATVTAIYWDELGREPDPPGLENWVQRAREGWTGEQIRAAIHASPEAVAFRAKPVLPHLEIRGANFVDASGARVVLKGTDQFCAFRRYLDGIDLGPLFQESKELGLNLWRVFMMGSVAQNGILDLDPTAPGVYEKVRPFADLLNAHGIIPLATIHVDAQDKSPTVSGRLANWQRMAQELRGSSTLLSGGNEWSKNGFNPGELSDPGMLWSRGSDVGDAAPFKPYGSFAEFHPRRDYPATMMDTVASPIFIAGQGLTGPLIIDEPPGFDETPGAHGRFTDPQLAWRFARHYATECGAAVFHSDAGMRCQVLGPVTRACAVRWQQGMTI